MIERQASQRDTETSEIGLPFTANIEKTCVSSNRNRPEKRRGGEEGLGPLLSSQTGHAAPAHTPPN